MGYQQSYLKFETEDVLRSELLKYQERDVEGDLARIICMAQAKVDIEPFKKGEYIAVVGGERSEQRNLNRISEGLGINNVKEFVFVDNEIYWNEAKKLGLDFGNFLYNNFKQLTDDEWEEFLMKKV